MTYPRCAKAIVLVENDFGCEPCREIIIFFAVARQDSILS
jgi:hypothetical protein